MSGKVFISCGQRPPDEQRIAQEIAKILKDEFGLTPYLAFKIQSLNDIMTITKELRSSDYYLFIDFLRDIVDPQDLPCSLFTHQELALAHHLGFESIIALQQRGTPLEGFLRYVLSNPEPFDDEKDLLDKIRRLIKERGWLANYSRNLVIYEVGFTDVAWSYGDHTGESLDLVWQLRVENKRPDVAAVGSVCILDYIQIVNGNRIDCPDRAYLKWANQAGYDRTILPKDYGIIDLFAIRDDRPGLFIHSLRDTPREPILPNDGDYILFYKLFSQGFPLLDFSVDLKLRWIRAGLGKQAQRSTVRLINI